MRSLLVLGVLTLLATGCDGNGPGGGDLGGVGGSRMPMSVSVSPNGTNLLRISQEQAYTASVRWSDGTETTEPATWRSDVPAIVTIDSGGRARALETGDATIEGVAQGIGGHLRIRVVPDYQGVWFGQAIARSCRDSGDWRQAGICKEVFVMGSRGPVGLTLDQDRDRLSGVLTMLEEDTELAPGLIRTDGSVGLTGRVVVPDDDVTLTLVFDPIDLRVQGNTMTARVTMTATGTGLSGDLVVEFEATSLVRSMGGMTLQERGADGYLSTLAARLRRRR